MFSSNVYCFFLFHHLFNGVGWVWGENVEIKCLLFYLALSSKVPACHRRTLTSSYTLPRNISPPFLLIHLYLSTSTSPWYTIISALPSSFTSSSSPPSPPHRLLLASFPIQLKSVKEIFQTQPECTLQCSTWTFWGRTTSKWTEYVFVFCVSECLCKGRIGMHLILLVELATQIQFTSLQLPPLVIVIVVVYSGTKYDIHCSQLLMHLKATSSNVSFLPSKSPTTP